MDQTKVFKALVKTVRVQHDAQAKPTEILTNKEVSEFAKESKIIVKGVSEMKQFLLKHQRDYVDTSHLTRPSELSDQQREQIDKTVSDLVTRFVNEIQKVRKLAESAPSDKKMSAQCREHRALVIKLLERYLKEVCDLHSFHRAVWTRRLLSKKKLEIIKPKTELVQSNKVALETPPPTAVPFSEEEHKKFEEENRELYDEMAATVDAVRQIETQVVEITRLQKVFTDNVLQQEKDIVRVHTTVVGTTETVKEANEEVRQAIKNTASFRLWVIFFLLVLSFSLLFLDWYNE